MTKHKVAVQKGSIDPNPMTMKQMTHRECLSERSEQLRMLKDGQTLKYREPKK